MLKWYQLPYNSDLKERARELRKAGNLSEVLFWKRVRNRQFMNLDFDRQKIIGNYIVDFFIKDIGVVIEIDGSSHVDKEEYDKERDEYLKNIGLKVIHIKDEDVRHNLDGVMEYLKEELTPLKEGGTPLAPLKEGEHTPLAPLKEGEHTPLAPLKEGNLVERILKHPNIGEQIKEWQDLGIVDENFKIEDIIEDDLTGKRLSEKYKHLPIDTKYFKDLELEILSLFDDLDKSLDGWLIKSENYQALNTLLPKFKEKVQTIYIDPPFNLDSSDQFLYRTNYKDANWATLLENRLRIAKDWLNEKGSIFVRCDYNGNWIVRPLMDEIFGMDNFRNEIDIKRNQSLPKTGDVNLVEETENLFVYAIGNNFVFRNTLAEREKPYWGDLGTRPSDKKDNPSRFINGIEFKPPKYRRWSYSQENLDEMYKNGRLKIESGKLKILIDKTRIGTNWTDLTGYSPTPTWGFLTENAEKLLFRVLDTSSNQKDIVMDFFLGSGTTTAVA
ncbi:MAG TPA: DUF559 domain-containing protein, partial [Candidatus Hydrogenedens sp.]|nr:DUF559 domain-containing protein [Candidatus Hydrogenedens sp.]